MYFLHDCFNFFRNIYHSIIRKRSYDNSIKTFLEKLYNNWYYLSPNDPLYYDILNLYIKYTNQNIKEYNIVLNELNKMDKNTNLKFETELDKHAEIDINEHMKYYIIGWYFVNLNKHTSDENDL